MGLGTHAVKIKMADMKRWEFLTSKGTTTNLKIHACTFSKEDADYQAKYIVENNEGVEAKVVEFK